MGDLNAASNVLGSQKTNRKGLQLQALLGQGIFSCIDDRMTTYERNQYTEKIDWIIATQPTILFVQNVETHPPLGTFNGHKPLTFDLMATPDEKPQSPRLQFSFKSGSWKLYRETLNNKLRDWDSNRSISSAKDIDEYAFFLSDTITATARMAIPRCTSKLTLEISSVTKQLIKTKHHLYRIWKKTGTGKSQYYRAREQVALSLRNDRLDRFKRMTHSLTSKKMNTSKVWTLIRKYHNKRTKQRYSSIMKYNQQLASTDKEKANLFAAYFENNVYTDTPDTSQFHAHISQIAKKIKAASEKSSYANRPPRLMTSKELKSMLKHLPNTAPGPDNVHNRCLKNFTDSLVDHLLKLFNASLTVGYVPYIWKKAYIILLLKSGKDRTQPTSYRPISLLSCVGKLLEKIVKERLTTELDRRNILPRHQAGFREGKSTMYNVLRLGRHTQEALAKHHHAAVILFDIKTAFDSVWHDGLIYKLNDLRLPKYLIRWLISFLTHRTASIELENQLSYTFKLGSGTPQGSPLSPLLYILYTADSMNAIPNETEYGLFADDTAIYTSSNTTSRVRLRLQEAIHVFEKWCSSWKLVLQLTKTELIHFSPHPRKIYSNPIHLQVGNTTIRPQPSARYLGVIFDQRLDWRAHARHVETSVQSRISLLRFLSRSTPESNDRIMLNLFKALIRPVLAYGSSLLINASDKVWTRLEIAQNKALRAALGLPHFTSSTYVRSLTQIPPIRLYVIELTQRALVRSQMTQDEVTENNITRLLHL